MKDKSKIPKGVYCYVRGGCPYRKTISNMYVSFGGIKCNVVKCEYLDIDTMSLYLEGDCWASWLLTDSCKPCGINISTEDEFDW